MGASNNKNANAKFYKLKEDDNDTSETKGQYRFFLQVKDANGWKSGESFSEMTGYVKKLEVKSYELQGATKENLTLILKDNESDESIFIQCGFTSSAAQNILNTLAGENSLGLIKFETGKPKESNGKWYPTMYIKNDGEKTNWRYSPNNGTWNDIPKITTTKDEDGNNIKRGVKANTDFWKKVLADINSRLEKTPYQQSNNAPTTTNEEPESYVPTHYPDTNIKDDLPF